MDVSRPYETMFPTVDSAVLTVLSGSMRPRTGREVARLAERSQAATQRVLDRLVEHGLVLRNSVGQAYAYELNREHIAAESVSQLVDMRSSLFWRLRQFLASSKIHPLHASVFGSTARGDGDVSSDVDIFLVRPGEVQEEDEDWRGQVGALSEKVFEWTGNHAGVVEVGEDELDSLRRRWPAVLDSVRAEGVYIGGSPVQKVLREV